MTALGALIQQQPVALWLGAGALVLAAGLASGSRAAVWAAGAGLAAATVAALAPRETGLQAAVFAVIALGLGAWSLRRAGTPHLAFTRAAVTSPPTAYPERTGAALLGRTARVRGAFVDGCGEVLVEDAVHPARLADNAPPPPAGALVRVVRVGEAALVVRPVPA